VDRLVAAMPDHCEQQLGVFFRILDQQYPQRLIHGAWRSDDAEMADKMEVIMIPVMPGLSSRAAAGRRPRFASRFKKCASAADIKGRQ
jgi:hypothetical protein